MLSHVELKTNYLQIVFSVKTYIKQKNWPEIRLYKACKLRMKNSLSSRKIMLGLISLENCYCLSTSLTLTLNKKPNVSKLRFPTRFLWTKKLFYSMLRSGLETLTLSNPRGREEKKTLSLPLISRLYLWRLFPVPYILQPGDHSPCSLRTIYVTRQAISFQKPKRIKESHL